MDAFLIWLEKYELLIELIITVLTIALSLFALFQTKSIAKRQLKQEEKLAKQQADLQERQIKISVYEQKVCLSIRNCIKRAPKSTVPGQHRFGF